MKLALAFCLLFGLVAFAAESSIVQVTHISPTEVGFHCTSGGKMSMRQLAGMTIITCSDASAAPTKK
jgi:hypothetical protein